jgi:hypothetical protein
MSARGFGSVLWAGAVAGAALGFYLVSLNVASERAELEQVETRIALAQRDLRLLQTEIGTRGRLAQLERWNVKFIRLSAPSADQFVEGGFKLASMVAPPAKPVIAAPVVLASAPVQQSVPQQPDLNGELAEAGTASAAGRAPSEMMHVASYSVPDNSAFQKPAATKPAPARPVAGKAGQPPAATKPVKAAMADPLSPLPTAKPKAKGSAPAASAAATSQKHTPRDSDH